ncbi:hypothetical protein D3C84_1110370 [compost metagenome]
MGDAAGDDEPELHYQGGSVVGGGGEIGFEILSRTGDRSHTGCGFRAEFMARSAQSKLAITSALKVNQAFLAARC